MKASAPALAIATLLVLVLTGCTGDDAPDAPSAPPDSSPSEPSESAHSPQPEDSAPSTPAPVVQIPDDCRGILSDDVLAQLAGVPLNDPAFGDTGLRDDGSLLCVWGDPAADTTGLATEISRMHRGPALDMLNELVADEDFTCYDADDGTRCEKTWANEMYPVTDGRTLFWRDGILLDTQYSNLAPRGYTASIVAHLFA